ncbi:MAG TPA: TIGR02281 family clan AA aspartic protease [Methyloceanibacter sp.]|nr:TIGR02281 family clan AA aspartic protease [Methyloceanibacter sp.]
MSPSARHALHEALLWAAAVLGGLMLFYFFDDIRTALELRGVRPTTEIAAARPPEAQAGFGGEVHLKSDARGHFVFEAYINDRPATFMADTGATLVVLTYEDAARLGLSPQSLDFSARVATANGISSVAPVTLDRVRVDDITVRDVEALVAERGALATNLLGMSFLGRLRSFTKEGSELVLVQ